MSNEIRCRYAPRGPKSPIRLVFAVLPSTASTYSHEVMLVFCPNCGTQNPETALTCSKCNFNLKGAAAPKFKGTMLMMNQPGAGAPPPAPPGAPGAAPGAAGSPGAPRPGAPIGAPGGPSKLKGTMVGVAPPVQMPGTPPPAPLPTPAPGPAPAFGAPPDQPAAFNPPGHGGQQVNPLGGTMVADNQAPYVPPPAPGGPAQDPYGAPPQHGGYGGPPAGGGPAQDPYGAPPQQGGYGGPPPQQGGYGGAPQQQGGFPGAPGGPPPQDFGAQAQQGFNQAAAGVGQAADQMGQAFGGMMQQGGYGGAPMQQGGPGGMAGMAGPAGPGGDINTTMPLILGIVSVFCCLPAAVVSIIFAIQAKTLKEQGQLDAARAKVKTAQLISFIAIGVGLVLDIVVVILQVVARH